MTSKIKCCRCGKKRNTFVVDEIGYFKIRLCIQCAEEEKMAINYNGVRPCEQCGELFIHRCPVCKQEKKTQTCPVCWRIYFDSKEGKGIQKSDNLKVGEVMKSERT